MINHDTLPSYSRYVLAGLGSLNLIFPDMFVAEVMIVDRSEILSVPFFNSSILGLVQQQGVITPLVSLKRALFGTKALIPEKITVVRLSDEFEEINGAGLVVDRVISSISSLQYIQMQSDESISDYMRLESLLTQLGKELWEPLRWH